MGFWELALIVGFVIAVIISVIRAILVVAFFGDFIEATGPWLVILAVAIPLIALIMYLLWPSLALDASVAHFLPFRRFPIPLSRYPILIAIVLVGLLLNAILFHVQFRSPLLRFILLVTEPIVVVSIVLLGSSFYFQYYVTQSFRFGFPDDLLIDILIRVGSVVACLILMFGLVMRPLWRALTVMYVVARPYLTLEVFRYGRHTRPLVPDRDCQSPDLLLISDLHIAQRGTLQSNLLPDKMLSWLKQLVTTTRPKAILLCGDITDLGDAESWNVAAQLVRSLGVQTLVIPGNHDVHFRRLAETGSNIWAGYFLDFLQAYFDKLGQGVGSFSAEEVLTNVKNVSSLEVNGFPQLIQLSSVALDVILLDSNRRPSSSAVTNAIGHVGRDQLARAGELVKGRQSSATPLLIAMHHHVLPVLSPDTALLTCDDAGEVLRFALEVHAAAIVHGHTHMPDMTEYSLGTKTTFVLSCGSALFPAQGNRAKEIQFPSCFGLRLNGSAIDERVGLFVRT